MTHRNSWFTVLNSMVMFHGYVTVYQRVIYYTPFDIHIHSLAKVDIHIQSYSSDINILYTMNVNMNMIEYDYRNVVYEYLISSDI